MAVTDTLPTLAPITKAVVPPSSGALQVRPNVLSSVGAGVKSLVNGGGPYVSPVDLGSQQQASNAAQAFDAGNYALGAGQVAGGATRALGETLGNVGQAAASPLVATGDQVGQFLRGAFGGTNTVAAPSAAPVATPNPAAVALPAPQNSAANIQAQQAANPPASPVTPAAAPAALGGLPTYQDAIKSGNEQAVKNYHDLYSELMSSSNATAHTDNAALNTTYNAQHEMQVRQMLEGLLPQGNQAALGVQGAEAEAARQAEMERFYGTPHAGGQESIYDPLTGMTRNITTTVVPNRGGGFTTLGGGTIPKAVENAGAAFEVGASSTRPDGVYPAHGKQVTIKGGKVTAIQ